MSTKTSRVVAGVALALAGAVPAAGQGLRTVDAGGGLFLHQAGERALVRAPGGMVSELPLPPWVALRRLARLDGGWLAAGEIDGPGVTDLILLRSVDGVVASLPPPTQPQAEPLRGGPLPLAEGGRLAGLAWLAGAGVRQTAVWAASWTGLDWSAPELVGPVGPGTQIAIDGAVLADGSWLLVWAAWDGDDDEILWSRRAGDGWSAPARLHEANDRPDVTPAIVATGRGALAAWNGFDGRRYRVRLAAFEDGAWRDLGFADTGGAVGPDLLPRGDGAHLLYRTVAPPSWVLHELGAGGRILRTAVVDSETTTRPGVAPQVRGAAGLEWPGERPEAPLGVSVEWREEP